MLGQHRPIQRRRPRGRADEDQLVAGMFALEGQYARYGCRRTAALLRDTGWLVKQKQIERLWRREGKRQVIGTAILDLIRYKIARFVTVDNIDAHRANG